MGKRDKVSGNLQDLGKSVVLMDSNHRGKIVALKKDSVLIELDEGLLVESAYGGFAVTDKTEEKALSESRVSSGISSAFRKHSEGTFAEDVAAKPFMRKSSGLIVCDLHLEAIPGGSSVPRGKQLEFQLSYFRRTLKEALPHRGLKLKFIHGTGDGVLRRAVRNELDDVFSLRCTYEIGDPAVTVVTIR